MTLEISSRRAIRSARSQRGQVLILGVLFALLSVLALMMVLNVGWAVHERIRLQNAADAQAYSLGVQVARSFNYFAYSNRALAGAAVSMTMLHAYHSEIAAGADAYVGACWAYLQMAGGEPCSIYQPQHCWHKVEDLWQAFDFFMARGDIADDIQNVDRDFRNAVDGIKGMMLAIQASQAAMRVKVGLALAADKVALDGQDGASLNLPAGTEGGTAVGLLNTAQYADVVEEASSDDKTRDMADVVNAARSEWTKQRGTFSTMLKSIITLFPMAMKIKNEAGGGFFLLFQGPIASFPFGRGASGLVEGAGGDASPDSKADTFSSYDSWWAMGMCKHNCAGGMFGMKGIIMPFTSATIDSNKDGGDHDGGYLEDAHDGNDHNLDVSSLFRYASLKRTSEAPFSQPSMYGYAEQDLRFNEVGRVQPFAVNDTGNLSFNAFGQQALRLSDQTKAKAVSKALVYYHRPGDWQEPPNLFNPFWRVKLHPMGTAEAAAVITASGEPSAAALAATVGVTASDKQAMSPSLSGSH